MVTSYKFQVGWLLVAGYWLLVNGREQRAQGTRQRLTEFRIPNTDTDYRIPNTEYRIPVPGSRSLSFHSNQFNHFIDPQVKGNGIVKPPQVSIVPALEAEIKLQRAQRGTPEA